MHNFTEEFIRDTEPLLERENCGSGGVSSWNDLTDKPFYDETVDLGPTITWDGNTEGLLEVVFFYETDEEGRFHKQGLYLVSESIPSVENVVTNITMSSNEAEPYSYDEELTKEGKFIFAADYFVLIALEDNMELNGITFPKKGVWFLKEMDGSEDDFYIDYTSSITLSEGSFIGGEVKKLDPKFIPDTIARKTVFYIKNNDADEYLYTDIDYTVKATRSDVLKAMDSGNIWCFNENEGFYHQVAYVIDYIDYAAVVVVKNNMYDSVSPCSYATAEYGGSPA